MAQWVKCLPCTHEDLSSNPMSPHKLGKAEAGECPKRPSVHQEAANSSKETASSNVGGVAQHPRPSHTLCLTPSHPE